MDGAVKPSVLIVYYTHTQQAGRVADEMARVFRERGCDVEQASIEFTDPRFIERFSRFPFKHAVWDLLAVLPGQTLRKTGQIAIPEAATRNDYDLICVGSATWFFTTNMPLRSYLVSGAAKQVFDGKPFAAYVVCRRYWSINLKEAKKLATKQGGRFVDAIHFQYEGGQIRSLLALLSYFGKGEMRDRSLGVKIPPTNLKPDFEGQAREFANRLADGLLGSSKAAVGAGG